MGHHYDYITEAPRSSDYLLPASEAETVPHVVYDYALVHRNSVSRNFTDQRSCHAPPADADDSDDGYLLPSGQGIPLRQIYNRRNPIPREVEPTVGKPMVYMTMTL